jgi:hypothetical protein
VLFQTDTSAVGVPPSLLRQIPPNPMRETTLS